MALRRRDLARHTLATLLLSRTPSASAEAPDRVLRFGGFELAPLMMGASDAPMHGALPDFIRKQIAPKTKIRLLFTPVTSVTRASRSLADGSVDVVMIWGIRSPPPPGAGRFEWIYLRSHLQVAVLESSPLRELKAMSDLNGLTVGVMQGGIGKANFPELEVNWDPASVQNWQQVNLRKLKAGRIDAAIFANPFSPTYLARQENVPIRLLTAPLPEREFTMLYSLKSDPALIEEFGRLAEQAFKGPNFQQMLMAYMD